MLLPDGPRGELLRKELRDIFRSRAYWAMLLLLAPLAGDSFIQAVRLYAEASRSALQSPEAARAMTPLDGILVPAFGACYLALTLLWPFVAIRALGAEKQSGSLKLLLQLPVGRPTIVAVKAAAAMLSCLGAFLPTLFALGVWARAGGHLPVYETLNLALGYSLYAFAVSGLAFFAAAVSDSVSTAAIVALALTLGSWILDFAYGAETSSLKWLSLTGALRQFEHGMLPLGPSLHLFVVGAAACALSCVWLSPAGFGRRLRNATALLAAAGALALGASRTTRAWDISEDRRNSFSPAEERALAAVAGPLKVTVHLSPEDSRLKDLRRSILDKLRRLVPRLTVELAGGPEDKEYGWIVYEYAGKSDRSTSNSEEEILPIIHGLAGQTVAPASGGAYPGYPLVADPSGWAIWFYVVIPALIGLAGLAARGRFRGLNLRRIEHALKRG